jgi:hypothetical protein
MQSAGAPGRKSTLCKAYHIRKFNFEFISIHTPHFMAPSGTEFRIVGAISGKLSSVHLPPHCLVRCGVKRQVCIYRNVPCSISTIMVPLRIQPIKQRSPCPTLLVLCCQNRNVRYLSNSLSASGFSSGGPGRIRHLFRTCLVRKENL